MDKLGAGLVAFMIIALIAVFIFADMGAKAFMEKYELVCSHKQELFEFRLSSPPDDTFYDFFKFSHEQCNVSHVEWEVWNVTCQGCYKWELVRK